MMQRCSNGFLPFLCMCVCEAHESPLGVESTPGDGCALAVSSSPSADALLDPPNSGAGREVWNTALPASFFDDAFDTSKASSLPCPTTMEQGNA